MTKYDLDFATSLACLKQEMVPIYQVRQLCGEAANPGFSLTRKLIATISVPVGTWPRRPTQP